MVGRSSNGRQTGCIIKSFPISKGFKGNQSLVVVHGKYGIEFLLLVSRKERVRAVGTVNQHIMFGIFNGWFNYVFFFPAYQTLIACMWVKSEYRNTRFINAKVTHQGLFH